MSFIFIFFYHPHTPSTITPSSTWGERNRLPFTVLGVCRYCVIIFLFSVFRLVITKNTILIFTAHQIRLTGSNDLTSDILGDTGFISVYDTEKCPRFSRHVPFSITINIAQALLPIFLNSFFPFKCLFNLASFPQIMRQTGCAEAIFTTNKSRVPIKLYNFLLMALDEESY